MHREYPKEIPNTSREYPRGITGPLINIPLRPDFFKQNLADLLQAVCQYS
jgi:hypothetical protein